MKRLSDDALVELAEAMRLNEEQSATYVPATSIATSVLRSLVEEVLDARGYMQRIAYLKSQFSHTSKKFAREYLDKIPLSKKDPHAKERFEVEELVGAFFKNDDGKTALWMRSPNPLLGGMTPLELLELRPGKLLKFVTQQLAENEK